MMWSIVLIALVDCAEDDAATFLQREAKTSEKAVDTEGLSTPTKGPNTDQIEGIKEKCIRKLFDANPWLKSVLADATLFARRSKARDPKITSLVGLDLNEARAAMQLLSTQSKTLVWNKDSIMKTDLWPQLKARGWDTIGPEDNPRFVCGGTVSALDHTDNSGT
jgi:hypothetical protein